MKVGVVTVSDRASRGEYVDRGGPAIREYVSSVLVVEPTFASVVVEDEQALIAQELVRLCDEERCALVVTTGGTGPAARDVTPEATVEAIDKEMPGFGELMRQVSLRAVPTAILSRQLAGIRGQSLIVNLPGQPKAIGECLDAVFPAIPYCLELLEHPFPETECERWTAFRPKR